MNYRQRIYATEGDSQDDEEAEVRNTVIQFRHHCSVIDSSRYQAVKSNKWLVGATLSSKNINEFQDVKTARDAP